MKSVYAPYPHKKERRTHTSFLVLQDMPSGVRAAFRKVCKQNKITMRDAMIQFLRYYASRGFFPKPDPKWATMHGTESYILSGISNDLKGSFKAACAQRQVTMRSVQLQFMEDVAKGTFHIYKPVARALQAKVRGL